MCPHIYGSTIERRELGSRGKTGWVTGKTQELARFVAGFPEKYWRGPDKWIN